MINENSNISALRVIDASFNRAMEGLRVIEEFTRMNLNDAFMSGELKNARHQLCSLISQNFGDQLLVCRDILNDVGTDVQTDAEYSRSDFRQIVRANFGRTLQSLRSIEEYSKLVEASASSRFERLRYVVYGLEKAVMNLFVSQDELLDAKIYVLTDTRGSQEEFEALVCTLIECKVDLIQLREKRLDDKELVDAGKFLSQATRSNSTKWIMNDRADLAVACNADGVHLGQEDLDVPSARRIVGLDKIIGVSTHHLDQAKEAVLNGANYIGVGPMFESKTKSFDDFASIQFLKQAANEITIPIFPIGGIDESNVQELVNIGAERIAVSHCVISAELPGQVVLRLRDCLTKNAVT